LVEKQLWNALGGFPQRRKDGFSCGMKILDRLIASLRGCCHSLPDIRQGGDVRYSMADIGVSAFSLFFMQSPSFLAHQRRLDEGQGRSNCRALFGLDRIPSDNHIRALLDPVSPDHFHPAFAEVLAELERCDGLEGFRQLGGHVLIALDGTEYHVSGKVHCQHCSTRRRGKDKTEHFHAMLGATIVAPGHSRVVPLEPEFIVPQDGHDKQDCESRAVRRWLERQGRRHARLNPVYLGDDLFACPPVCEAVRAAGGHFLFVCKPSSHPTVEEYVTGIDLPTLTRTVKRGRQRFDYRYRWLGDVPLRGDAGAMTVNWLMVEIVNATGEVTYRNSVITDLDVGPDTVVDLAACGRARWKIENESFNVLKNNGYNLEHNFGHGKITLSAVFVSLNLLAFAFHTVCDLAEDLWRRAMEKMATRGRFFENLRSITSFLIFPTWDDLLGTLAFARPPPTAPWTP
jgi:hypothetical protein